MDWSFIFPIAASEIARSWDTLNVFLLVICVFFFLVVIGPMVFFAIRYRFKPNRKVSTVSHNFTLEVIWTAIPTIILMVIFWWGWVVYRQMTFDLPQNHKQVRVVAKSWSWTFQYEDGRTTTNQLFVPVDTPVRLIMTSEINDVLHSFFVPNLRIKKDLVPGLYTNIWFKPEIVGQYQIFCTEYCGAGHSEMLGKLIVLSKEDYELWTWGKEIELPPAVGVGAIPQPPGLVAKAPSSSKKEEMGIQVAMLGDAELPSMSLVEQGEALAASRGCVACHSSEDRPGIGPSYVGLFGREVELADGTTVIADENYIRESIENPHAKIVKGYENVLMPPYPGLLTELELNALMAYLKSLEN